MVLFNSPPKPFRILLFGGTIDSESYQHTPEFIERGDAPEFVSPLTESKVREYIIKRGYKPLCQFTQMDAKDSQKINAADTNNMLDVITGTDEKVQIVVFGTDAMARKANEVAKRLGPKNDKIVLFVGAMEPLSHGARSDGYGNLDYVLQIALQGGVEPGVYVAMRDREDQQQLFKADEKLKKMVTTRGGRAHKYFEGTLIESGVVAAKGK